MRRLFSLVAVIAVVTFLIGTQAASVAHGQAYEAKPKLVVFVVIDQFRGDYLERYRADLKGRGFKLFLDEGAWFPDCYYNYVNTKTAPGHATIGTGAYSDGHGIESNEWWDAARSYDHRVSSVQDERYKLVDLPAGSPDTPGASPLNLRASTLGDEVKLATQGKSRVFGVSLKDRAAILPVGQSANAAYWMDNNSGHFTTSTYYQEHLPQWAAEFNASAHVAEAVKEAGGDGQGPFNEQVEPTPAANRYELAFSEALITGEKLGQHETTDVLAISLSAHDIMGHRYGPDSEEERKMVMGLDRDLDSFFGWLDKTVGLKNIWLALSADHGVAPVPATAAAWGMNSATVDLQALVDNANAALNARFSNPGNNIGYILPPSDLPYLVLDRRIFEIMKIDEKTAEEALRDALPEVVAKLGPEVAPAFQNQPPATHRLAPTPAVAAAYTRLQLESDGVPQTEFGKMLAHSYAYHGNWYVMVVLNAYQMQDQHNSGTTHFSPWSYDRHVPLAFYGAPFQPGTYRGRVEPVDIAATLASLLGVNQPSASVGKVLTQSLKSDITIINR
jgi:predicted AlkP superfamily pyrophosphatase or phosphodiesterase